MGLFQIDIQKTFAGYFWTNVYIVEAADLSVAHNAAFEVFGINEQAVHAANILIDRIRTSTLAPGDNSFRSTPVALFGTLATDGNQLPLFNVVKVDIEAATGRPSRKYYRSGLGAGNVAEFFRWDGVKVALIQAVMETMIPAASEAGATWVDPQGELLGPPTVSEQISMHQLRRGSRRNTEPVLTATTAGPSRKRGSLAQRVYALERELEHNRMLDSK